MKFVIVLGHRFLCKAVNSTILWIDDPNKANTYPSKYSAKKHLRMLDNVPEDVKIIELKENI